MSMRLCPVEKCCRVYELAVRGEMLTLNVRKFYGTFGTGWLLRTDVFDWYRVIAHKPSLPGIWNFDDICEMCNFIIVGFLKISRDFF